MSTKYYQQNKEMLQKRLVKAIKISLKKKKTENNSMLANGIGNFLKKMNVVKKKKTKSINMPENDKEISLKKRKAKSVNMLTNNMEIFLNKKKTKYVNLLTDDIKILAETSEIRKL